MTLSDRTKKLKSSPTLELAAKGRKLKAEGKDVISLAVGEPDWDSFTVAKTEAIESIQKGFTKYVPANGIEELRKAIADTTKKDLGLDYSPDQVTVTTGGKFSIFACLQVLLNKGDEVLIPTPYWVSYPDMTELAEGKPVFVPSTEKNNFKITAADLESKITRNSKLFILNSPSNPTGAMYTKEELKSLADILKRHPQLLVLSDDIYNKLVFDKSGLAPHLLHVAPELKDRVIMINGASKTYAMTGWRIGWAIGPQEIISAMTKYQSQSVSCAASFVQRATFKAIVEGDKELKIVQQKLLERKDFAVAEIKNVQDVSCFNPDGAFYLWINITKCLNKKYEGKAINDSRDFSYTLLDEQNVIAVPGAEFGMEGYIRLSFAIESLRMTEAFRRMNTFILNLK
jgi:aspartate aminotransferase